MMAGTGDDMGGFKGLKGDAQLGSHQDLTQVGADSGGTKIDFVDSKGTGSMGDDVGGSYVFVGGGDGGDPVGNVIYNVEVKDGVDFKDDGVVEVESGGVVVGTGGNDAVEESDYGLLVVTDKGVALHAGLFVESGSVGVVGDGQPDSEVKVEDQVGLKDENGVGVGDQVDLKDETVGVGNGEVVVGAGGIDQDYAMEENNRGLSVAMDKDVEDGQPACGVKAEDHVDFESTTKLTENRESQTDTDTEFGERQEEVIESVLARKLSEHSVKSVEQNFVLSSADLGENKTSEAVVLRANDCELVKVVGEIDVGEGQMKQTEIKLVEESLEPQISVTSSVDCVSNELGEDQAKLKQINDLVNDADPGESKEAVIKSAEAGELSDVSVRALQQDVIVSPADFGQESDTVVLDADGCELAKVEAVIEVGVVDRKPEEQTELKSVEDSLKSQSRITESVGCLSNELEEDSNKLKNKKDHEVSRECIDKSQSVNELDSASSNAGTICLVEKMRIKCGESIISGTADGATVELEASGCVIFKGNDTVNSTNLESDRIQMSVESSGNVPNEICGSYLASIDAGTVSVPVPEDADCVVGLVQGCKSEGVVQVTNGDGTMTTETSTLQTNLEEQIGGSAISPELNGNPDVAESNCMLMQAQSHRSFQSDSNGGAIEPKGGNLVCPVTVNKSKLEAKNL